MENFVVSARKYRPTTFDSVVGQQSITSTLKNAIKTQHLAQAFLFCGPRGVGKTTCARILAKTINCFNISENIEACNECESCISFNEGQSLNVYELDAASNNSVDDIRNLIDQVLFFPQLGTHKVYIIDEVHMLSNTAFNAFLKTLEEPPKHAIFILATTEKHKIIPTILSRCQIFDFNRIQIEDIALHLANIAKKENIIAETDALHIIAQKADGALRDALSIFDQIVSFSGNNITYQHVIENLNILDYDYYFKITDAVFDHNISEALLIFNEILQKGFDGHNFINGLSEHFRNLLICQDSSTLSLLEVGDNIKEKYKLQSTKGSTPLFVNILSTLAKADTSYKSSKNQRLLVEITLMQLCSVNQDYEKKKNLILLPFNKQVSIPKQVQPIVEPKKIITKNIVTPKSEPVITEKKLTTSFKDFSKSGNIPSFSINETKSNETVESAPLNSIQSERPTENFTIEQFQQVWNTYKNLLIKDGKTSVATVFEYYPEINNTNILIIVENKVLEENIAEMKTEILDYFRKELKNYNLSISTKINQNYRPIKAYTPNEKFDVMSQKNPLMKNLVKIFDMEIGYPNQ